ncbi:hypothetical protein [Absidia glauca]|uniref:Reverse transcriptase domain-containing protein n=1 Tax=Absidia glauca TaxID=4829 RepID=A0A168L3X4_ABSGL|nr:hypothetical protein [Absidia glauca]
MLKALLDHSPSNKSPGLDGISFEVYKYLGAKHDKSSDLLLSIIVDAQNGIFPQSWLETRTVLLFKKGHRDLLANWRPLSMINCDAKLFTKMLANRFHHCMAPIINPFQTGFMHHRLISDNGWITQTLMQHIQQTDHTNTSVAILLDQEKAYDRVHPTYLRQVLGHMGFPRTLVATLISLFFSTKIHVSLNGWLGAPFTQARGLRQGDPLSPLLFNLAFEPLLRSLLANSTIRGIPIKDTDKWKGVANLAQERQTIIKLLAYADDLVLFLNDLSEWEATQRLLTIYAWLLEINAMVRSFVMPFYPKPSMDFVCNPKKQGGLGLVHLEDQALALHNIYIERMVAPRHDNPLTGVINVLIRLYTGHNSLVPFLIAPQIYARSLKQFPHFQHLANLLKRLPRLTISATWTPRITRYLPLRLAFTSTTTTGTNILNNIRPTMEVQQLQAYDYDRNEFVMHEDSIGSRFPSIQRALNADQL